MLDAVNPPKIIEGFEVRSNATDYRRFETYERALNYAVEESTRLGTQYVVTRTVFVVPAGFEKLIE